MRLFLKQDRDENTEVNDSAYVVCGRNVYVDQYDGANHLYYNGWYTAINLPFIKRIGQYMDPYTFGLVDGTRYMRIMMLARRIRNNGKWGVIKGIFWRPV